MLRCGFYSNSGVLLVMEAVNSYRIRPHPQHRFRVSVVREVLREVLRERLSGVQYDPEETPSLTRSLSDLIKVRLTELGFERYKMVVQVVLGEQRGEGVRMVSRCMWDSDTDSCVKDVYMNDSLFCVAVVFGIYYY